MSAVYYPLLVVDNFLENPDNVREYALSLDYYDNDGRYPGKRTKNIHTFNNDLQNYLANKFFNLFYDFLTEVHWDISISFQLISPYNKDKNSILNQGWIHQDTDKLYAGVLYLSPTADLISGTSIYRLKKDIILNKNLNNEKIKFYKNNNVKEYQKALTEWNSSFEETVSIKNIYNRLIIFDSMTWHGVPTLHSGEDPRLTCVFFVNNITALSKPPLERIKRDEYILSSHRY